MTELLRFNHLERAACYEEGYNIVYYLVSVKPVPANHQDHAHDDAQHLLAYQVFAQCPRDGLEVRAKPAKNLVDEERAAEEAQWHDYYEHDDFDLSATPLVDGRHDQAENHIVGCVVKFEFDALKSRLHTLYLVEPGDQIH